MATERLSMRKTREILRQKLELGRSHREVAASVGLSVGAVGATLVGGAAAGLSWASVQALSEEALDERLYGAKAVAARPLPDCAYIHVERKKAGVTLELLHLEYLDQYPDGYRYTQFCERYREWLAKRGLP
jgi:transposase